MAFSISVLGILVYGPDLLMAGPASIDAVPARHAARAAGIVNGIGSLGQLISAYVVAMIVSRFGWDQLFTFFVLCAAAAGGLLTLRWNKGLERSGNRNRLTYRHLKAVILDWAGTAVDFGSLAPVAALQRVFAANGVPITRRRGARTHGRAQERPDPRPSARASAWHAWAAVHGQPPAETDVERIFSEFLPRQSEILAEFSAPIPGVAETVERGGPPACASVPPPAIRGRCSTW